MPRPSALLLGLAASIALLAAPGCGSKPAEVDTAEVTPDAKVAPPKADAPTPSPAKDAPKE